MVHQWAAAIATQPTTNSPGAQRTQSQKVAGVTQVFARVPEGGVEYMTFMKRSATRTIKE